MVLHGNNYNSRFNLLTAALVAVAAFIIGVIRSAGRDIAGVGGLGTFLKFEIGLLLLSGPLLLCALAGILFSIVAAHVSPVKVTDLLRVVQGHPGSLFELANSCMRNNRDFWSVRTPWIFWGERSLILTSEKSVRDVLLYKNVFERTMPNPEMSVTSCHTVLGSPGGGSAKWKRLRSVCAPFFDNDEFEERTGEVIDHIVSAVKCAAQKSEEIDYFTLVNRLVVEIHLLLILGVKSVPAEGMDVDNPIAERGEEGSVVCLADAIDGSLNVGLQGHSPAYTSDEFAPLLNFLTDRLSLPPSELGGIERILCEANKRGEVTPVERLHNCMMFMIALAPSPAAFWTTVHVFRDRELKQSIRDEANASKYTKLSMCLKETLRMYAPVPIMIQRYVVKEEAANKICLLQGSMALKKGDHVVIPTIIIQNDPHLWQNPDEFRPERWDEPKEIGKLGGNRSLKLMMRVGSGREMRPVPQEREVMKARYFPFGMGQHTCLGQPYAVWISMTIASTLVNCFDVELSDPDGIMDRKPSYKRIRDHIYSFPKHPLKAKISPLVSKVGSQHRASFSRSRPDWARSVSKFLNTEAEDNMATVAEEFEEED